MTQDSFNTALEVFGNEVMYALKDMVKAMFGDAAVRDEQLESLLEEYQSYIEDDEKLVSLLKMYCVREATDRRTLARSVSKMFLMEKVFGKK